MPAESLPSFFDMDCTDKKDKFSSNFFLYNDHMSRVLNERITPYGVNVPSFSNADVASFPANVTVGTIWYNSNLGKLQFKNSSGVQTVTSTP